MNSERLAQDPGTEKMPEAVRGEVGIVAAAVLGERRTQPQSSRGLEF